MQRLWAARSTLKSGGAVDEHWCHDDGRTLMFAVTASVAIMLLGLPHELSRTSHLLWGNCSPAPESHNDVCVIERMR